MLKKGKAARSSTKGCLEEGSASLLVGGGLQRETSSCDCRTLSGGDGLGRGQCGQRLVAMFGELSGENIEKGLGKEGLKARKSSLSFYQEHWGAMKGFRAERRLTITFDSVCWVHPGCLQT